MLSFAKEVYFPACLVDVFSFFFDFLRLNCFCLKKKIINLVLMILFPIWIQSNSYGNI